jgi:hypothetical protein
VLLKSKPPNPELPSALWTPPIASEWPMAGSAQRATHDALREISQTGLA